MELDTFRGIIPPVFLEIDNNGWHEPEIIHLAKNPKGVHYKTFCGILSGVCTSIGELANCVSCVLKSMEGK